MPGFPVQRAGFAGDVLNLGSQIFDIPGIDLQLPFRPDEGQFFRPTATSIRPVSLIQVTHPQTGAPVFFKHAGRPILFSGDLRAAKMVHRLARRARRASPRR